MVLLRFHLLVGRVIAPVRHTCHLVVLLSVELAGSCSADVVVTWTWIDKCTMLVFNILGEHC